MASETCIDLLRPTVGTKKAIAITIKNNRPQKRYTLLRDRLMALVHQKDKERSIYREQTREK